MCEDEASLLLDANVLIDFVGADISVLGLIAAMGGGAVVLTTTLAKVDGLTARKCQGLGLQLEEPTAEEFEAAQPKQPGLAFDDRLCIHAARMRGCTCVTNDKKARRTLGELDVPCLWGLDLLLMLVEQRRLTKAYVKRVVKALRATSPAHYSEDIGLQFETKLNVLP